MSVLVFFWGIVLGANALPSLGQELPCTMSFGVDISDGVKFQNGSILKDSVLFTQDNFVVNDDGATVGCICRIRACLRKCCPIGEILANRTCQPTAAKFVIPAEVGPPLEDFHVVFGDRCVDNKTKRNVLDRRKSERLGEFRMEKNGKMYLDLEHEYYNQQEYCVDYIEEEGFVKGLICNKQKPVTVTSNVIGIIVSMPFLLATFVVYAVLPEKNLYGKCLMFYVISLFFAYLFLTYIQHYPTFFVESSCIAMAMFCYFFFMVSFLFMNVMSIDIWWTFRVFRGATSNRKQEEQRRFLFYCIYALGLPLIFVIIIVSLTMTLDGTSAEWYNPGVAAGQCWLSKGFPTFFYFYLAIAIVIATNIVLFGSTAFKIRKIQNDTAMLKNENSKKHHERDKRKFNLYLKLSLAMGINWSFELISWAVDWQIGYVPRMVWYFSDFLNAIYGIFIFFIFVFKKNIWTQLKARYQKLMGKTEINETITALGLQAKQKTKPKNKNDTSNSTNETTLSNTSLV